MNCGTTSNHWPDIHVTEICKGEGAKSEGQNKWINKIMAQNWRKINPKYEIIYV